jgi:hypothetical protein
VPGPLFPLGLGPVVPGDLAREGFHEESRRSVPEIGREP